MVNKDSDRIELQRASPRLCMKVRGLDLILIAIASPVSGIDDGQEWVRNIKVRVGLHEKHSFQPAGTRSIRRENKQPLRSKKNDLRNTVVSPRVSHLPLFHDAMDQAGALCSLS